MEITFDTEPTLKKMSQLYADLGETEIKKATAKALNLTIRGLKTKTGASIGGAHGRYNVRSGKVKSLIREKRASPEKLRMSISLKSNRIKAVSFGAKTQGRAGNRKVKVTIRKGNRKEIRGAFLATMQSGHTGVFKRVEGKYMKGRKGRSKHSQAIQEIYTISIAEMMSANAVYKMVKAYMVENFESKANQAFREMSLRLQGRIGKKVAINGQSAIR